MELKGQSILFTSATLMVTVASFSALFIFVRQTAGGKLAAVDRFLMRSVLTHALILVEGALLPSILRLFELSDQVAWKGSAVGFGIPLLVYLVTYPTRRKSATGQFPSRFAFVVYIGVGIISTLFMIGYLMTGWPHPEAVYVAVLVVNFFTLSFTLVQALELLLREPKRRAVRK